MVIDQITEYMYRKVLPTVYDDALSYYEEILVLIDKINELIVYVGTLEGASKTYTDEQITLLRSDLTAQIQSVYNYAQSINVNLTALIGTTKVELITAYTALIDSNIATVNSRITSEVATLNGRITYEVEALKDYIDSQIIDLQVLSPVTGATVPIQTALNQLADLMKFDAFTATAYDALEMTATYYDGKEIQAIDYDFRGSQLLP